NGNAIVISKKVSEDGKEITDEAVVEEITMVDELSKVTFSKKDVGGKDIAGAELQILDADGNVVDEWTSSTTEKHTVEGLVTGATYVMHEVTAPDGYILASDITFKIDEHGNVIVISKKVSEDGKEITDEAVVEEITMVDELSKVTFSKKDVGGKEIAGAKLQILDADGNVVDSWTSSATEKHIVEGLVTGVTYVMHEVTAPDGYILASDITFKIDEHGNVIVISKYVAENGEEITDENMLSEIVMIDELSTVTFSKTDVNGKKIAGAKLQILDADGNVVDSWTSSDSEDHIVEGLVTGVIYVMHEEAAPDGYELATDITFMIDENGDVYIIDKQVKANGKVVTDKKLVDVITMVDTLSEKTTTTTTNTGDTMPINLMAFLFITSTLLMVLLYHKRKLFQNE
ncbi:MAG: hypothetical protein J6L77_10830, partial [Coprococcus sp.]|nr:hypothetical protein [Coprococcus sp.]